jgi:unsaturated rhamnogalacturonyl hydrolase
LKNDEFETGKVSVRPKHIIFGSVDMYLKEISVLDIKKPAIAIAKKEGNIMAIAKYGKGAVFAVGDPWLYNEYLDGRKLPAEYENFKAAEDLVKWLLTQSKK